MEKSTPAATVASEDTLPSEVPSPPAPAPINRRLISGERVLCRCSLELPKHDPFSNYRARREGFIILNVRGGSLYIPHQLTERTVLHAFPPGKASLVRHLTLYPESGAPIVVGDVNARYLKLNAGRRLTGLVLRFVGLSEAQLEVLNGLSGQFPIVSGAEEEAIPEEALHRL